MDIYGTFSVHFIGFVTNTKALNIWNSVCPEGTISQLLH